MADAKDAAAREERRGIANLLALGADIEIFECDKTGHVQERWLHSADGQVVSVGQPPRH